jgi:hypothetical protein
VQNLVLLQFVQIEGVVNLLQIVVSELIAV